MKLCAIILSGRMGPILQCVIDIEFHLRCDTPGRVKMPNLDICNKLESKSKKYFIDNKMGTCYTVGSHLELYHVIIINQSENQVH